MTEQILKQEVMIDGQQVLSIATPDIVCNHVAETAPHTPRAVEVDPMKLQVMQNAVARRRGRPHEAAGDAECCGQD